MITPVLSQAWDLYRRHFGLIAAVVVVIWLPLDLLSSYMDFFVFDPEDFRRSFRFSQFLDNFVGIIASAGVISIGHSASLGSQPTFASALSAGASSWGRMWWTRFLTGLAVVFGLLLLIIPGIYLFVRLALVEPVAVCERVSGPDALRRSYELTEGRFWQVFCLGLVLGGVMLGALACVVLPSILIPALDHWLFDAATSLVADLVGAFGTLCVLCAYLSFSEVQGLAEPGAAPNGETSLEGGAAVPAELPPVLS